MKSNIKKYFWDADIKESDVKKHPDYVIIRRRAIKKRHGLSSKSIMLWKHFFNIKDSEILCLKKSYQKMQKTHWHQ